MVGKFARLKKTTYLCTRLQAIRSGFSAVGSAHVWGARGRWFESSNPDRREGADNHAITTPFFFASMFACNLVSDGIQITDDTDKIQKTLLRTCAHACTHDYFI